MLIQLNLSSNYSRTSVKLFVLIKLMYFYLEVLLIVFILFQGNRDIVGYGWNGVPTYMDRVEFPAPAVRFQENSKEVLELREKEQGDWKALSLHDKKACVYKFCFLLIKHSNFSKIPHENTSTITDPIVAPRNSIIKSTDWTNTILLFIAPLSMPMSVYEVCIKRWKLCLAKFVNQSINQTNK